VAEVAGLDRDRVRDWAIVRLMNNALWEIEEAAGRPGGLSTAGREWLTTSVTVVKAVQD